MTTERALLQHLAVDEDGNIQTHRPIVFYEADGVTPYAGVFYDQASGGAPVTSFETSHLGVVEAYTPLATRKSASVEVAGTLSPVRSGFFPRTEDLIVQESAVLADLRAGLDVTHNSNATYALSVTQSDPNGLLQRWRKSDGSSPFLMLGNGLFASSQDGGGVGIALGNALGGHRINVLTYFDATDAASTGSVSFKNLESVLNNQVSNASADSSAASFWMIQDTAPGDAAGRAIEAHADRTTGTAKGWWGMELGIASTVVTAPNTQTDVNVGLYVHASTQRFANNVGAPIPQDVGIVVTGSDGFRDYARFRQRAPSFDGPVAFRVAGGYLVLSGVPDQDGDVVSMGRWRGSNGTALLPAVVGTDVDSGVFFGSNQVSISTNQTERLRIGSDGLLDFRDIPSQIMALGGGANATLGAVGGTGPTVTAQSAWIKVMLSGAAARFIPLWT